MIFIDYIAHSFSAGGTENSIIVTLAYRAMVFVEVTSTVDWDGPTERIRVYSIQSHLDDDIDLWSYGGSTSLYYENRGTTSAILPSGTVVRVETFNESVAGTLHIFRMPF